MTQARELNFEKFRDACGLPEYRVRMALAALGLKGRTEGRRVLYDMAWIDQVKEWDRAHMGQ